MRTVLTNLSDDLYAESRQRLNESAVRIGITEVNSYGFNDIKSTSFYLSNQEILDRPKGTGAWLWKPYIILETLNKVSDDDVVIYSDCGIEIIEQLDPLIEICHSHQDIMLFANGNFINADWTKRDCFVLMNADHKDYWYSLQCDASFSLYRKTKASLAFVQTWLDYCTDKRILMDTPNVMGKKNLPGFTDHRWDQSVLSVLAKRLQLPLYRMPSQFGNHYKSPEYRIKGEFNCINQLQQKQLDYYATQPYYNSPYFQLLNHHRSKKTNSKSKQKTDPVDFIKRIILKRMRKLNRMVSMWYNKNFTK